MGSLFLGIRFYTPQPIICAEKNMGYIATWKVLEELMLDMHKKGVSTPASVVNDLRSAKLMIQISESPSAKGEQAIMADEYLGNVESILLAEAEKTLGSDYVDEWLKRLDEAMAQCETCQPKEQVKDDKFIIGVPRDQKWVRVEPHDNLTSERIKEIAKENNLSINSQSNGRLVAYGQPDSIKAFLKKMTLEATKK
jgi:hypothetical protein